MGGKGLKSAYFHPSTVQNPHVSEPKCLFRPTKGKSKKHRNIKIYCDFNDLSVQPIDEICLFSVMTVYDTRWKVLIQSRNSTIIH